MKVENRNSVVMKSKEPSSEESNRTLKEFSESSKSLPSKSLDSPESLESSVAVLGVGSWGTALASVLARNGHSVRIWDIDAEVLNELQNEGLNSKYLPGIQLPKGLQAYLHLKDALAGVRYILIAVPSHVFSNLIQQLKPLLTEKQSIITATKGLEPKTGEFLHQVVEQILGHTLPYAVLSGPSFAREVARGFPTAVSVASTNQQFALEVANYFRNRLFAVYTTQDVLGVQLGAVVKNVLAVAVGVSDGLGFGANARAALMTRGLAEMVTLGQSLGADQNTLMGLTGCGDIILTCTDNQSRNRRFGLALAEGLSEALALQKVGQVVEAVYNVRQLCHLAEAQGVVMPIAEQVFNIIKHGVNPKEALESLFATTS